MSVVLVTFSMTFIFIKIFDVIYVPIRSHKIEMKFFIIRINNT